MENMIVHGCVSVPWNDCLVIYQNVEIYNQRPCDYKDRHFKLDGRDEGEEQDEEEGKDCDADSSSDARMTVIGIMMQ